MDTNYLSICGGIYWSDQTDHSIGISVMGWISNLSIRFSQPSFNLGILCFNDSAYGIYFTCRFSNE